MGNSLEYDEDDIDDLFEEEEDPLGFVDTRKPIASKARAPAPPVPAPAAYSPLPSPRPSQWPSINQRLSELYASRTQPTPIPRRGVNTLRAYAMLSGSWCGA